MDQHLRAVLVAIMACFLCACSGNRSYTPLVEPEPEAAVAEPVGRVALDREGMPGPALDVAVIVFNEGLGEVEGGGQIFPTVRKAESLLLPVTLAQTLRDSGAFGVVRVVHSDAVHMALTVEGDILRADGAVLELRVRLRGADGRLLGEQTYRDEATDDDYPVAGGLDPFADIYRAIANDVVSIARDLGPTRRETLMKTALLDFGVDMAPNTFSRFLEATEDGGRTLVSYPADDDPMLRRLQRLRRQDDLFIDSVDQQYTELYDEVAESYALWREFGFELQRYGESYINEAQDRKRNARRGTYAAMQQVYGTYRKVKIQEEDLRALVAGFAGESLETVLRVDDGVFRLSGSVEDRYREWREILSRIDALETGGVGQP